MKVLIVGGSASGKSEYAETLAVAASGENRYYIATMEPFGSEGAARIARHREMRRERGFTTIERYTDLRGLTLRDTASGDSAPSVALLEDIGNLVANEVYTVGGTDVAARIAEGIASLAAQCETLVVVSNDITRDAERYDAEMTQYLALVGEVNRRLAADFDEVYEAVAGVIERRK